MKLLQIGSKINRSEIEAERVQKFQSLDGQMIYVALINPLRTDKNESDNRVDKFKQQLD